MSNTNNDQQVSADSRADAEAWYREYYAKSGAARNDLRTNAGVLFQVLASDASLIRAFHAVTHDPGTAKVLDVGCGGGGDIHMLARMKYRCANITGIDVQPERLAEARELWPRATFLEQDASRMPFADDTYDLVVESTMFATLPDDALRSGIAAEMVRVCRPGGYLILRDWWTPKPGAKEYKALTRRQLRQLFAVGQQTEWIATCRGALVPPVGRFLSARLPKLYFLATLVPLLVGQVTFVLRKTGARRG